MRQRIQEMAVELGIPYLLHFSRLSNLESLLTNGIYPRNRATELPGEPIVNDQMRLDGHLDAVSLSIGFPNYKMFYKYRQETDEKWVVIVIAPNVLWDFDCAFCRHNAADGRISSQPVGSLKTLEAFQSMYQEHPELETRQDQNLKNFDPTDVQAEVLVFDVVPPQYIAGVVFEDAGSKNAALAIMGQRKAYVHAKGKGLFASRNYARRFGG